MSKFLIGLSRSTLWFYCRFCPVTSVVLRFSRVSGLVKLSELKAPPLPVKSHNVDDSMMTQREGEACEEEQEEEVEAPTVRRRNRKCSDGGEVKVRGRRQRDFDPATVDEEEAEPQAEPTVWTQNQQKLLELALQQFPRGTPERWDRIAKVVPGKSKVRRGRANFQQAIEKRSITDGLCVSITGGVHDPV